MAAPKLRFKNAEGAEFTSWVTSFIGDECKITTGNKDTQNKIDGGKYPFFVRSQIVERINTYSKDCEAILTSGDGVGVGKNYHYINGKFDFHQRVYCLYDFSNQLLGKYLYIYFSNYFFDRVKRLSAKNSVDSVRMDMISKMEIKLPSLVEQTKIASFLSTVDEKISQLTQKHELLSQYKQGMMQKLFSQQIRFKADDGSEFGEWRKAKVGNITETIFGYPFDSKEMVEDNNGIPLMRGINIGECHIRHSFELDRFFLKDTSKLEKYFVRVNDIVLSMDGSKVGRNSAFVTEKDAGSLLVQRVCILREKENTNIQYVYQWIISKEFHRYVDQVKTSSGIPHISGKQIQDYEISYPCLEEQTKIANFLSAIDQKIGVVAQQIEHAKQWKKGLLQQMFV
ncbi:TPA: restriction endonuclease subunit S [Acinetobacter baumannii]